MSLKYILAHDVAEQERMRTFAFAAAKYFNEHPEARSFTESEPEPGKLFAVKWAYGPPTRSVLVFTLPDDAAVHGDLDYAKVVDVLAGRTTP